MSQHDMRDPVVLLLLRKPECEAGAASFLSAHLSEARTESVGGRQSKNFLAASLSGARTESVGGRQSKNFLLHINDISLLLLALGLGTVVATQVGGRIVDRLGSGRLLVVLLVIQLLIEMSIAYVTTSWFGAMLVLFIWGMVLPVFFIAQQHRLLNMAPKHTNVISALNSSMNYLGIAFGALLGGASLSYVPVTQLGLIGTGCGLLGLISLLISLRAGSRGELVQPQ